MPFIPNPVVVPGYVDPAHAVRLLDDDPLWTVEDMVFNAVDSAGVRWWVTLVEGWRSGAPLRVSGEDRPQTDGAFDAPSYRSARTIMIQGVAVAPDAVAAELAVDRLKALLTDMTGLKPLTAHELTRARMAHVRLASEVRAELAGGRREFDYQVTFLAPDPRLYSAEATVVALALPETTTTGGFTAPFTAPFTSLTPEGSTGEQTVVNAGTLPVFPTVTIAGPVTDPVLENVTTGRSLRLSYTVAAGDHLLVDFADSAVLLNGATPVDAHAPGSSFWPLVKGPNLLRYTAFAGPSGSPATITAYSAWN